MAWLGTYAKRIPITIEYTFGGTQRVDATVADFPVLVYISAASGISDDDASCVFDELTSDENALKIAVTTSDGTTECSVEIEKWDDANEKAWLWVKVPSVSHTADTPLYLYYDADHAASTKDNSAGNKVGLCADGSAATHAVWDANFKMVHHMTGANAAALDDSTSNNNDVTDPDVGAPTYDQAGKIANAVEFDGTNDALNVPDSADFDFAGDFTLELWGIPHTPDAYKVLLQRYDVGDKDGYLLCTYSTGNGNWRSVTYVNPAAVTCDSDGDSSGGWQHIVLARSGTTNTLYVDGVAQTDTEELGGAIASDEILHIAESYEGTSRFDGLIDEVRISDDDRSAAWIKASYYSGADNLLTWGSEEEEVQTLLPSAIASLEAFGTAVVTGPIIASGIESAEAFGAHQLNFTVLPSAIISLEAFGTPQLNFILLLSAIESAEAFGSLNVAYQQFLSPDAIVSVEAFGTSKIVLFLLPSAIVSAEAFGTAKLNFILVPNGIVTLEAFGTTKLIRIIRPTERLVGSTSVSKDDVVAQNYFHLSKFTAGVTDDIIQIKIYADGIMSAKVAVYADNAGEPGALLNAVDVAQSLVAGWNIINFPATSIVQGTDYWLAFNSG